jgi:hypothetical protein
VERATPWPPERAGVQRWLPWVSALAGPLVTVLVTGVLAHAATAWFSAREARETNERLYAQLLTQREQSDTTIRKDMFSVVINRFLADKGELRWRDKVLHVELLANNFSQSLDLAPLFKDIARRLPQAPEVAPAERRELMERLDLTASALNGKQLSSLARRGHARSKRVAVRALDKGPIPELIKVKLPLRSLVPSAAVPEAAADETLTFEVEALRANLERRELELRLLVRQGKQQVLYHQHFWVGLYDFPMLSNVQLPFGLRAALALTDFDVPIDVRDRSEPIHASLHLVVFPSSSASFKERQDYDDILLDMVRQRERQGLTMGDTR